MTIYAPSFFKPSEADYIPKRREISDVSNDVQAEVTTTENHGYEIDQLLRLHVSGRYGMQLNGVKGKVITIPTDTTFTVDINTSELFPYVTPTYSDGNGYTESHVVPITGVENNVAI